MQKYTQSPLVSLSYNSLQDEHLVQYYSSPQRRRHLRRMGLITKDGMLVDELTFQRKALQREYRRRHKDAMETTMTTTVTENQWKQKAEIKKKLEQLAKFETVRRIKREKLHPLGVQTYHPKKIHLIPGQDSSTPVQDLTASSLVQEEISPSPHTLSHSHLSRILETHKDKVTFSPEELQEFKQLVEAITGARMATPSALCNRVVPHPPNTPKPRHSAAIKVENGHTVRRRPHTAPTKSHKYTLRKTAGEMIQEQSVVQVKLCYLGSGVGSRKRRKRKTRPTNKYVTEVVVQQQARGYTPLPVYKGELRPGDSFSFKSIRYTGMPFALVIYTNGMIDCRVSVCCEYRHGAGTRLGGRSAHFKVVAIEGGSPCYQCKVTREEKSKLRRQDQLSESSDSESEVLEQHPQSTPQLTTLQHPAQLDSPLQRNIKGKVTDKSPSPASSLYSASFHSESSQPSSDDEDREQPPTHQMNTENLNSSAHQKDENVGNNVVTNDPSESLETANVLQDEREGQDQNDSTTRPALVTKGGVTIEYQLGPIPTSDSATQTDEQASKSEPLTTLDDEPPQDNVTTNTGGKEKRQDEALVHASVTTTNDGTPQTKALVESPVLPDPVESNDAQPTEHTTLQDTGNEPIPTDTANEDVVQKSTVEVHSTSSIQQSAAPVEASSNNNQSQQDEQQVTGSNGELESISKNTLTQVSERKISASDNTTDSSRPSSPSAPQPDDQKTKPSEHEPEETGERDDNTVPDENQDNTGAGGQSNETREHLCEEEFTKAWD